MKNGTLLKLAEAVEELNMKIETLKTELGANTTATRENTLVGEGITVGLKELAKETGSWRADDKEHHKEEGKLDEQKVKLMKDLKTLFEAHPNKGITRIS